MKQALSDRFIATLKPPKTGRLKISDLDCRNLTLEALPSGKKIFRWIGRMDGKRKDHTLGPYPIHSLADARRWANAITENRNLGVDLVAKQEEEAEVEAERQTRTCDWLFALYMEGEGKTRKTAGEKWRIYNHDIKPVIGSMLIDDVDHDDLAEIVDMKFEIAPSMSNNIVALIKRWWKWSVTKGRTASGLKRNPSADLVKLGEIVKRTRAFNDYEIGLFFKSLHAVDTEMAEPLTLLLYTGTRRAEGFEVPWTELDELETKRQWIIPGTRTKNKLDFVVPLPDEMVCLLQRQRRRSGNSKFVFPNRNARPSKKERAVEVDPNRPMSGYSDVIERIRAKMQELAAEDGREVEHWTIHDLRRTLSTGMNGLHDENDEPLIRADIVERVINHKIGGVAGIYNRYEYLAEKRKALRVWADHLNRIRKANKLPALPTKLDEEDQRDAA